MTTRFRFVLPAMALGLAIALAPAAYAQGMSNDNMSKPATDQMTKPDAMGKTDTTGKDTMGKTEKAKKDDMSKKPQDNMAPAMGK
jgi:pentapeptide MXKDX repeat protein